MRKKETEPRTSKIMFSQLSKHSAYVFVSSALYLPKVWNFNFILVMLAFSANRSYPNTSEDFREASEDTPNIAGPSCRMYIYGLHVTRARDWLLFCDGH